MTISGAVQVGPTTVNVLAISDDHKYFQAGTGSPHAPADADVAIRAMKPDYILVAGDFTDNSVPWEISGYFTQSLNGVTGGIDNLVTVNSSTTYSEFGITANPNNYVTGFTDAPYDIPVTAWVFIYDDAQGGNFDWCKVSSVTHTTFHCTPAKSHAAGFIMRCHGMAQWWDYMLKGRLFGVSGNHDIRCLTGTEGGGCTNPPGTSQGPVNLLNYFQAMYLNTSSPFVGHDYYAAAPSPLFTIVGVDNLATGSSDGNHYPDGTGVNNTLYGNPQELALRSALTTSAFNTPWVFSMQHFQPNQPCGSSATKWSTGSVVDVHLFGHTHGSKMYLGPNCPTQSGTTCSMSTKTVLYIDVSDYAAAGWDPMTLCEDPVGTAACAAVGGCGGGGQDPNPPAAGVDCPGCTRIAINSWRIANNPATDVTHFRGFTWMTISQHQLTATNYRVDSGVVSVLTDYVTGNPATWTLTK